MCQGVYILTCCSPHLRLIAIFAQGAIFWRETAPDRFQYMAISSLWVISPSCHAEMTSCNAPGWKFHWEAHWTRVIVHGELPCLEYSAPLAKEIPQANSGPNTNGCQVCGLINKMTVKKSYKGIPLVLHHNSQMRLSRWKTRCIRKGHRWHVDAQKNRERRHGSQQSSEINC